MKLGEAEPVRVVDEHRVRAGDVHPALDDRGAHQDVRLASDEREHHLLERPVGHLAVPDQNAGVGGELADLVGEGLDVVHPVVHEEDLSLPGEFPTDRLRETTFVPGDHLGDDRPPIERRRGEARDVPEAEHRHVQRSRDRRRTQGEHVRHGAGREQSLLVLDAEPLFLVDHDETEILEPHVLREQAMRSDHDVDAALLQVDEHLLLVGAALDTTDRLDPEGIRLEPAPEGPLVLFGEHRGRHEDRDLLAELRGLEGGADRDLGLSESDVAADQSVHRRARRHVPLDRRDRGDLVLGLLVRELGFEFPLPVGIRGESNPRRRGPGRLHPQHLPRQIPDRVLDLGHLPLPPLATQQGERRRRRAARPDVLLDELDAAQRDVEMRAPVELQRHDLLVGLVLPGQAPEPDVTRDSVIAVHHEVARLEAEEILPRRTGSNPIAATPDAPAIQKFVEGHDRESLRRVIVRGPDETAVHVPALDADAIRAGNPVRASAVDELRRSVPLARRGADQRHVVGLRQLQEFVDGADHLLGERRKRRGIEIHHPLHGAARRELVHIEDAAGVITQRLERRGRTFDATALADPFPVAASLFDDLPEFGEDHGGRLRQEVDQRDRPLAEQAFGATDQLDRIDPAIDGLRRRIDLVDPFDLVTEEIQPDRLSTARREEIEQPAPDRELARRLDHVGPGPARFGEPRRELGEIERLARADHPQPVGQIDRGGYALHQAGEGCHDDAGRFLLDDAAKQSEPRAHEIERGVALPRHHLERGERRGVESEIEQFIDGLVGVVEMRDHQEHRPRRGSCDDAGEERGAASRGTASGHVATQSDQVAERGQRGRRRHPIEPPGGGLHRLGLDGTAGLAGTVGTGHGDPSPRGTAGWTSSGAARLAVMGPTPGTASRFHGPPPSKPPARR